MEDSSQTCYLFSFIYGEREVAGLSTKALVQQLKDGERRACTHLVDRYQALLLHEAVHTFSLRRDDAQELVSDVLLAVVNGIQTFTFRRGEGDFHVWVMAIFRNKVRDFVRQQASRGELTVSNDELEGDEPGCVGQAVTRVVLRQYQDALMQDTGDGAGGDDEDGGPAAGKLAAIADALERLKSWERVLLRCRALDVSYEEIASYTGKPASHLKVYHARVRKKFVNMLAEYYPELVDHEERQR